MGLVFEVRGCGERKGLKCFSQQTVARLVRQRRAKENGPAKSPPSPKAALQDRVRAWEDGAAVERADSFTRVARRGSKVPCIPGFGARRRAEALAPRGVLLSAPEGASGRLAGVPCGGPRWSECPRGAQRPSFSSSQGPNSNGSLSSGQWSGSRRYPFRSSNARTE